MSEQILIQHKSFSKSTRNLFQKLYSSSLFSAVLITLHPWRKIDQYILYSMPIDYKLFTSHQCDKSADKKGGSGFLKNPYKADTYSFQLSYFSGTGNFIFK